MPNNVAIKNANVTISIKGLALSHYNQKTKKWETRFLRHVPGHNLKLSVKKNGTEIFSKSNIKVDEKISIVTVQAEKLQPRYNKPDEMNLDHLVNFNSPNMCGNAFKFKSEPKTTFLETSEACFYVKTLSKNECTVYKNKKKLFARRIGVITGGDIVALDKTEIKFEQATGDNQTLSAEPGTLYEIIFDNDCPSPPSAGESDFDRFSDIINTLDKFTLTGPDVVAFQGDPNPKEPPCNSGEGGESGGGG
jgi:hypothetical protein